MLGDYTQRGLYNEVTQYYNMCILHKLYYIITCIILYTQVHLRACSNKKGVNNSIRPTILVHDKSIEGHSSRYNTCTCPYT